MTQNQAEIGIIMGSDSDLPIMKEAASFLETMGINYEISVISAHRTPERAIDYARTAHERGLKVIIAGAGGAAHLPGVIAALTALPVIGVPINSKINGIDSLYSIAQMPSGIPVATVAIDGAQNAGILAAQILAASQEKLYKQLLAYKEELKNKVELKSARLEELGYQRYLNENQKAAR